MAKVLSSISGNLISAASAGYAPTNGADVSAIASAYQVVSATGTQTYAGTAYVTSLNSAPVSAERAGNAANAALANSAWYDGTGRLISALPDSAAVSAIASAYASGKQDSSAMSAYALSSDVSGVIDTVSGNSASWGGGATGDYVEKSSMEVTIGSGNNAYDTGFAQGDGNLVSGNSFAQGSHTYAHKSSMAQGSSCGASSLSFAQGKWSTASAYSFAQGLKATASGTSFAQGYETYAYNNSIAIGNNLDARGTAAAIGRFNLKGDGYSSGDNVAFVIGDGTAMNACHDLLTVTKDGEITVYSSTADATGIGLVSSITSLSSNVSAIASAYADSAASGKLDTSAISCDTASAITAIGGSSIGGGAQVVTATATGAMVHYDSSKTKTYTSVSSVNEYGLMASTLVPGAYQTKSGSYQLEFSPTASMFGEPAGIYSGLKWATGAGLMMSAGTMRGYIKANELFLTRTGTGVIRANIASTGAACYVQSHNSASACLSATGNSAAIMLGTQYGTAKIDTADINLWNSAASAVSGNSAAWGETAYIPLSSTSIEMTSTAYSASYNLESIDLFVKDADSSNVLIAPDGISFKSGNGTNIGFVDPYHIRNWDGVYNTVSDQSANWGGSALQLSAGAGISLTLVGNVLVISTAGA